MIHTVFSAEAGSAAPWQSQLLEYSWRRVRQPGELVRLAAVQPPEQPPHHRRARVVATQPWSPHPYTGDEFPAYNQAASVLEWLFRERIDGTILLLDADCVLRAPVTIELEPGGAVATAWPDLELSEEEPFGLGRSFDFLHRRCVNRSLKLTPVRLPVLIHSRDLQKMAARWLELTSIIRSEAPARARDDAHRIAYVVAAAEYEIPHEVGELATEAAAADSEAPIVSYQRAVESERGEIVWDKATYTPWERPETSRAAGPGRDVLVVLEKLVQQHESGGELATARPRRRKGVREARVLDRVLLDIPNRSDSLTLNSSAAAIWELCDDKRTLTEITSELEVRFGASRDMLRNDVESTIDQLASVGALDIDTEPE